MSPPRPQTKSSSSTSLQVLAKWWLMSLITWNLSVTIFAFGNHFLIIFLYGIWEIIRDLAKLQDNKPTGAEEIAKAVIKQPGYGWTKGPNKNNISGMINIIVNPTGAYVTKLWKPKTQTSTVFPYKWACRFHKNGVPTDPHLRFSSRNNYWVRTKLHSAKNFF